MDTSICTIHCVGHNQVDQFMFFRYQASDQLFFSYKHWRWILLWVHCLHNSKCRHLFCIHVFWWWAKWVASSVLTSIYSIHAASSVPSWCRPYQFWVNLVFQIYTRTGTDHTDSIHLSFDQPKLAVSDKISSYGLVGPIAYLDWSPKVIWWLFSWTKSYVFLFEIRQLVWKERARGRNVYSPYEWAQF